MIHQKTALPKLVDDKGNTKEVMNNVLKNLNVFEKLSVLKHFVDKTRLTENEIAFSKTLSKKTQYSSNGKFAYVEITPDDKEWENLGKDTIRSKKVLQQFRKDTLAKDNVDAVAVFYPTNDGIYKMSIQTKKDYAKQIIDNIKDTVEIFEIIKPVYNFKSKKFKCLGLEYDKEGRINKISFIEV